MKRIQMLILLIFSALLLIPAALAQDDGGIIAPTDPDNVNPEAHISYPLPVYVVRDSVDIRGTVSMAELRNFFIEFRPLALDMMDMDEADDEQENQWFPATLPQITAVTDDVLGTWNTVTLGDGLYELRLKINTGAEEPLHFRVSPIRVENNPPSFVALEQVVVVEEPVAEGQAEAEEESDEPEPAPEPEATATPDSRPRVTALVNSNVRAGDSILYTIVGGLREGETALIKGLSSYNTGWFYIELDNGRSGFIHPNIVRAEGDLSNLARINPPPLPPTPIPVPTAVPVQQQPSTGANLIMRDIVINPHPASCGQAYNIQVTVENIGNGAATVGGTIRVTDLVPGEPQRERTTIAFGPLAAGASQRLTEGYLTPTVHIGREHNINLELDYGNQIAETNENDNFSATAPYILGGSC